MKASGGGHSGMTVTLIGDLVMLIMLASPTVLSHLFQLVLLMSYLCYSPFLACLQHELGTEEHTKAAITTTTTTPRRKEEAERGCWVRTILMLAPGIPSKDGIHMITSHATLAISLSIPSMMR